MLAAFGCKIICLIEFSKIFTKKIDNWSNFTENWSYFKDNWSKNGDKW